MTKQKITFKHYAAIDIGSNAVRLLIKRVDFDRNVLDSTKVQFVRVPLRLGFDAFTKKEISGRKAKKLMRLIKAFAELMKIYDVSDYKACATSAIRDARNGKEIISWIKKETGVRIHILEGKEEAKLIYDNHFDICQDRTGNYMYVDVGGGSTEINLLVKGNLIFSKSYNIGTIRVLSNTIDPLVWDGFCSDLKELAKTYQKIEILGSGGNINKLYRLIVNKDKKLQRIPISSLTEIYHILNQLTFEERMKQYNLKNDRADVIVPASHIFLLIACIVNASYIYVPTIGLSDGIINELIADKLEKMKLKLCEMQQNEDLYGVGTTQTKNT